MQLFLRTILKFFIINIVIQFKSNKMYIISKIETRICGTIHNKIKFHNNQYQ